MADYLQPDLCVIGAGSGGLTVVAAARSLGASVVLVEEGLMGGDCLNTGCVPSKALIAASKRAHSIQHAGIFGVATDEMRVNFGRIHEHVHQVIAEIAPHDSVERFEAMGATVLQTRGTFVDKRTLQAGDQLIRARRFVIATGSHPAIPPIPGLDQVPYLTNQTIFDQTRKPQHLVIIGGGPIGMEMAQSHRRLGSDVTIIEMAEPLHKDDRELAAIALRKIEAEGVRILARTRVESVAMQGQQVAVTISRGEGEAAETDTILGSHLLVAAGRTPNTTDMGLDKARVRLRQNGSVRVNKGMKSSNRRIYAIGDVAGGLHFTHVAGYQGGLVVRNALFGLPVKENINLIPWATYTDPEIAHVGLSEEQARKKHGNSLKVLRVSYAQNDRAQTERRTEGLVKLLTDKKGHILGAGIVGLQAGELINFFAFAIANGLKISAFTKFVAPYPTLAEITKRAAYDFYKDQLDNPWLERLRKFNSLLP